jgi:hypothetical protein
VKIKAIAAIAGKRKSLAVYTADDGEQWLGIGAAAYRMSNMPHLTPETVLTMWDIPPAKQKKDWFCAEAKLPLELSFEDYAPGETQIEPLKTKIEWEGECYWLFPDDQRIYAINESYLKPAFDEWSYLTFCKRLTGKGGFTLCVKVAMELKAVVMPVKLDKKEDLLNDIITISRKLKHMATCGASEDANTGSIFTPEKSPGEEKLSGEEGQEEIQITLKDENTEEVQ